MAPSESSAAPSYPARVVRYLSERRHALECGSLEREAYDAEVERVLAAGIPAERLALTADCGLSAIPRWLGVRKLEALAAGAKLVRGRA